MNDTPPGKRTSLAAIAASVLAGAFGVQSERNRQRDFAAGKPWVFVVAGLVFTLVFVLAVYSVVALVLANAK
jgi:hypothetical protein